MIDTLIFDLDGTLADTIEDVTRAINHAMKKMDLPEKTPDEIRFAIGPGQAEFMNYLFTKDVVDKIDSEQFISLFRDYYWKNSVVNTTLFPGIMDILDTFKEKHLTVASNKPKPFVLKILEELAVKDRFELIFCPEDVTSPKPHPEMIVKTMKHIGSSPQNTLMIGDTDKDIAAGRGAGVVTCGVAYGYGDNQKLMDQNPDHFIQSAIEIKDIVLNHTLRREASYGS